MKTAPIAALPLVALLASCGSGPVVLPETAVERAATCAVVFNAQARQGSADVTAQLTAAQRGAVLRPALLHAAEGEEFVIARAAAVTDAMPALGEDLGEEQIETLGPQCAKAFPPAPTPVTLPEDQLTAALGCDELGDFMRQALSTQAAAYKTELDAYYALNQALDTRLAPLLSARGISGVEETQAEARKALGAMVKLGEPTEVLAQCTARYVAG